MTPAGTRQPGWPAREYTACRQSQCPPGRSAASVRPAARQTDDEARPARSRRVRKTQCPPTASLPGIQSGGRRTDRVAPRRSTARARKAQGRAVVTVGSPGLSSFRFAQRSGYPRQRSTAAFVGALGCTPFRSPSLSPDTPALMNRRASPNPAFSLAVQGSPPTTGGQYLPSGQDRAPGLSRRVPSVSGVRVMRGAFPACPGRPMQAAFAA